MELAKFMEEQPHLFEHPGRTMEPDSLPKAILADVLMQIAEIQGRGEGAADPESRAGVSFCSP